MTRLTIFLYFLCASHGHKNKCITCISDLEEIEWDVKDCFYQDTPKRCLEEIEYNISYDKLEVIQYYDANYDNHEICQKFGKCKINHNSEDLQRIFNKKSKLLEQVNNSYLKLIDNFQTDKEFYEFEAILDKTLTYFE